MSEDEEAEQRRREEEENEDTEADEEDDGDDAEWICSDCNGSGEGMWSGTVCHFCRGLGVIYGENTESD